MIEILEKQKKYVNNSIFILGIYDLLIALLVCFCILFVYLYDLGQYITLSSVIINTILFLLATSISRFFNKVYRQVWRYGGSASYLKLLVADAEAFVAFYILERLPFSINFRLNLSNTVFLFSIYLLISLAIRIVYRYCYITGVNNSPAGRVSKFLLKTFSLGRTNNKNINDINKKNVAILGAGNIGTALAQEFIENPNSEYIPVLFLDSDENKINREIYNIPVYAEELNSNIIKHFEIAEVIFTAPNMEIEKRQSLYKQYKELGLNVKTYDYPVINPAGAKKNLRNFEIEELLFRKPNLVVDEKTTKYFKNKKVLITGGGGSIGSELTRQVAAMSPKQIILVDMYENGAYDVRTEMKFAYKDKLDLKIEIANVCDKENLDKIFKKYKPDIVIHAAAHKHVPLMEDNVVESIQNNVFGTLNVVEASEKHNVKRFIMVSTDKAVNPVNVMGATKRMCEMVVLSHANTKTNTKFSCTRFGNVLNSAGSVVPIFKRELEKGGPLTVTDFRIIRYFMTIPEASQLVLKSSAMAKNGELFVLDMGKPVKILDLAENMIRVSGLEPYKDIDIVEVGLRPGEKLYEELLIKSEDLTKTSDELIYIEKDTPLSITELNKKLKLLQKAVKDNDDSKAKEILHKVVPTYKEPDEVNNLEGE